MKLKDKVAVITGAGSGIGRATALLFAKEGAKVVVVEVNKDTARETVDISKGMGARRSSLKLMCQKAGKFKT